jgi:hypothetical protein
MWSIVLKELRLTFAEICEMAFGREDGESKKQRRSGKQDEEEDKSVLPEQ